MPVSQLRYARMFPRIAEAETLEQILLAAAAYDEDVMIQIGMESNLYGDDQKRHIRESIIHARKAKIQESVLERRRELGL